MRDVLILAIHLLVTLAKFLRPGGVRQVAAESLLLKHQLLISNRSRRRAPNLTMLDRLVLGLTTLFLSPHRIPRLSVSIRPATLFKFHKAMVHRKYRLLFSSPCQTRKPGPKGPSEQLIAAIVEMKHRNPKFGCVRIAQQIAYAFGIEINKDVVRRVLAIHFRPKPDTDGPSWLTVIAQAKDSVWSVDLFRVESIVLRSHWVLLVIDIFTRRIIGFGIGPTCIDGIPEEHAVKILSPDHPDWPFNKRMRDRSEWNGLEPLDLHHAQVGEPTVKAEKWIVIGTEVFRFALPGGGGNEHSARRHAIDACGADAKADDTTGEDVHNEQDPMAAQDDRFNTK